MTDLSQKALLTNLEKYYKIQKGKDPKSYKDSDDLYIEKLKGGICKGLTSILLLFFHLERENEFTPLIKNIVSWGGEECSLTKDLIKDIEYFFSIANYMQSTTTSKYIGDYGNNTTSNLSSIADHKIEENIFTAFNSNKEQFKSFLLSTLHDGTVAHISGGNHVISIHKRGERLFFYDPNNKDGIVSGNIDEIYEKAFNSIAIPAGYTVNDIMTIKMSTFEHKDKLVNRTLSDEELDILHKKSGHYDEKNKYSSRTRASPLFLIALAQKDPTLVKNFLKKSKINLFQRFSYRNNIGKDCNRHHATFLIVIPELADHFADFVSISEISDNHEKIDFIQSNIAILNGLTHEQRDSVIKSLNLSIDDRTELFTAILENDLIKESNNHNIESDREIFSPILLNLNVPEEKIISTIKESFSNEFNIYKDLLIQKLMDPNAKIHGTPILHYIKPDHKEYFTFIQNGANQFQRSENGNLAIDLMLDTVDDYSDIIGEFEDIDNTLDIAQKIIVDEFITVLFMSEHFLHDIEFRKLLIFEMDKVSDMRKSEILSSLLERDDLPPESLDALILECQKKPYMLDCIKQGLKENSSMLQSLSLVSKLTFEVHDSAQPNITKYSSCKTSLKPFDKSASAPSRIEYKSSDIDHKKPSIDIAPKRRE